MAQDNEDMHVDTVTCQTCSLALPLQSLAGVGCDCLLCLSCLGRHVESHLRGAVPPASASHTRPQDAYTAGEAVLYRARDGVFHPASIAQVDRSVQPPQYGITLTGSEAAEPRFTEASRLMPAELRVEQLQRGLQVGCPGCGELLSMACLQQAAPAAVALVLDALTDAWLQGHHAIRCPTCQAIIERLPAAPGTASSSSRQDEAEAHLLHHRFRCAGCSTSFCDACRCAPYHQGLTCKQNAAPSCLICGAKVLDGAAQGGGGATADMSVGALRAAVAAAGVDASWCLERSELTSLYSRTQQVCSSASCQDSLRQMCTRTLPCGHWCAALRGDACLCVHEACEQQWAPQAAPTCSTCPVCCDLLATGGPCIRLGCGHATHLACARERIKAGWPGPQLSFNFLFCPLCGSGEARCGNVQVMTSPSHFQHAALEQLLQPMLELRTQVRDLARRCLRAEGLLHTAQELRPGGRFDGRPADFAVQRFQFFQCANCSRAYFGGARECGDGGGGAAAADGRAAFDAQELVCGECCVLAAGKQCPKHGGGFIEFKCRYCCSPASWFCWGTTHMCARCHDHPQLRLGNACRPGTCGLPRVRHPPPGEEFCLGCGLCRRELV